MKQLLRQDIDKMMEGFNETAQVVSATLGPDGRNVYIADVYTPRIINDGVRIANSIGFNDEMKNAGAYVVKNASAKTNDDVGDGTTTTVVLLKALVEEAIKRPESRAQIKHSLEEALPKATSLLKDLSEPMKEEDIERVAYLVSEHEDIAKLIKEIYEKLGHEAAIQIEDSKTGETKYEIEDGYRLYDGYMSEWFYTDEKTHKGTLEDVPVVVATQKMGKNADLVNLAKQWQEQKIAQAAFFVADIDDQMLGLLVKNHLMKNFLAIVVRCNAEQLEDVAAITGATIIGEQSGVLWENVKLSDLGRARKIVADRNTTLIQADSEAAAHRALELEVDATDEPNMYRQARLQERAARLRGKIAILKVGGFTELEREYKELKTEDAIKALPAAFKEGLVKGAGRTWHEISEKLKGNTIGEQILKKALKAPLEQLKKNSGKEEVPYKDIVDPTMVERVSLENAVSAAGLFITTIAAVVLEKEPNAQAN